MFFHRVTRKPNHGNDTVSLGEERVGGGKGGGGNHHLASCAPVQETNITFQTENYCHAQRQKKKKKREKKEEEEDRKKRNPLKSLTAGSSRKETANQPLVPEENGWGPDAGLQYCVSAEPDPNPS